VRFTGAIPRETPGPSELVVENDPVYTCSRRAANKKIKTRGAKDFPLPENFQRRPDRDAAKKKQCDLVITYFFNGQVRNAGFEQPMHAPSSRRHQDGPVPMSAIATLLIWGPLAS